MGVWLKLPRKPLAEQQRSRLFQRCQSLFLFFPKRPLGNQTEGPPEFFFFFFFMGTGRLWMLGLCAEPAHQQNKGLAAVITGRQGL